MVTGIPTRSAEEIERAFDDMTDELVAAITAVRGDAAAEAEALRRASRRYMEVRGTWMNEPPLEYLGHFYMVDGVGLESTHREHAWARLAPTPEESDRWGAVLDEATDETTE